jgi:CBS domain-containing protein
MAPDMIPFPFGRQRRDLMANSEIEGSYRTPSFEKAQVSDAMHPGVVSCARDTPLRTVAQIMAERHIHSVVVSDLGSEVSGWGVVADVDLLGAADGDLDTLTAGETAGTELPTVTPDETLSRAAQLMAEHGVSHLIVVEDGRAVGVVSTLDVAGIIAWGRA